MSRGPGRPAKLIPAEVLEKIEAHLDEGWPFQEITKTYGIGYYQLNKRFPGRQWTNKEAADHGVLVRKLKAKRTMSTIEGKAIRVSSGH